MSLTPEHTRLSSSGAPPPPVDGTSAALLSQSQAQWKNLFSRPTDFSTPHGRFTRKEAVMTRTNQRTNIPWGDPLGAKPTQVTRVYAQNVNGLSMDRRGGQFDDICSTHKELEADIFCGQEHNLDTTQMHIKSYIYDAAKHHWDRSRVIFGTTPISFTSHYKPGGTFILTTGSVAGRIKDQVSDKWGRWVFHKLIGQGGQLLLIVSAYQPIDKHGKEGNLTIASQHRSLLLQSNDTTNPRTSFRRDLLATLLPYVQSGAEILLLGDFNETLGSDPDGMSLIASRLQLIDLMASRHSSIPPATYARGSKRLDYALASQRFSQSLVACGYDSFNARFSSDHRGYFFDFNTAHLFGNPTQQLATLNSRLLRASNIHQVTSYIDTKYELLLSHNAFERGHKLTFLGNRHQYAERLDNDVLATSLVAESRIPQFGAPAWSVELASARKLVQLLTKYLSAMRTHLDHTAVLATFATEFPDVSIPATIRECSHRLRAAKKEVYDIVQQSFQRRDHEREQRIKSLETSGLKADKQTAQILRRLKKAEDIKNLFAKLKHVRTKEKRQGVVRLEIPLHPEDDPKTCSQWTQVDVPSEIVRLLQERNRAHFGQAQGTPFTVPPLSDLLGFTGTGSTQRAILGGQFDTSDYSPSVKLLLSHLQHSHEMAQHVSHPTISDEEFTSKLRIWSESTATSPSNMHLGHYKSLIARHSYSSDASDEDLTPAFCARRDELNMRQIALRNLHLQLLNYALERGYSYRRWHTVANTILFKDKDSVRLHRTRVIHIYEADFNLALGIKWRNAMHQAEDLRLLNEGQYGSRPYRNAIDPVFLEELQLEISRATRKPLVLTNYDAMACYDRIIPNLGMTVSQKYGVPPTITETNASTLFQAEYRVRTELGVSPSGYRHELSHPIYGTGQGSSNSPAIWCFLSSTLFDCYDDVSKSASYSDPTETVHVNLGMVGFVDDCNGQTNEFHEDGSAQTVDQLLNKTRSNAQMWSDVLSASGGALELQKCSCHVLQWQFSSSGAPVLVPRLPSTTQPVSVQDSQTQEAHQFQMLGAYQAHKTLGHYKEPAGSQSEQYKQLRQKSDDITAFLWTCPLSRLESWTYYYACYLPAVCYPLATSSLTYNQLDTIQRQAMKIIIPRCGFNRNTKREILYGPLELGGANFRHLYTQQGIKQTMLFIKHWRQASVAGKLLRIAVAWFQKQIGVSFSLLDRVAVPLPHLESKWIGSLRQFLASINASLHLDDHRPPVLQRFHDFNIMDVVMESQQFSPAEIRRINYCRLYLQAETVSDLTQIDGRKLDPHKLRGTSSLMSSFTVENSIHQERPADREWQLWRRANKLWSTRDGTLHRRLGNFVVAIHEQHQRHRAYCCDSVLYVLHTDGRYAHCPLISPQTYRQTKRTSAWEDLPTIAVPMLVKGSKSPLFIWKEKQESIYRDISMPSPDAATFVQYVASLPTWEAELLQQVQLMDTPYHVLQALTQGIRLVSDGSDWDNIQGSFGWTISDPDGGRWATGMGPAHGSRTNSFRSESYGMLSGLCFLRRLLEFTGQSHIWQGILGTDSQSLIDTVLAQPCSSSDQVDGNDIVRIRLIKSYPLEPMSPDWDIVRGIQVLLQSLPEITLQHIPGHQDRKTSYHSLSLLAQLNVDADRLADKYQCEFGHHQPHVPLTEWAGVHLILPQGTITSRYESALRYQSTGPPLMKYMQTKYGWNERTSSSINWRAHGASLRKHISKRTHLTKFIHGILPTNYTLHRIDPVRRVCPACKSKTEHWDHVLRCQTPVRSAWRIKMVGELDGVCAKWKTKPELRQLLYDALSGWLNHDSPSTKYRVSMSSYPTEVHRLIAQQNLIGWEHLFQGRFSVEWGRLQDEYYARLVNTDNTKRRTGHRWQTTIIGKIWEQWFLVWATRNKDKHGVDSTARAYAARQEVDRGLRELYELRYHMEPSVRELLCSDISGHYLKSTKYNQNWLLTHGPTIRSSVKSAKAKALQNMRSIREWFRPKTGA